MADRGHGAAAARLAFEQAVSLAYADLAENEHGEEGGVVAQVSASASAAAGQTSGLAAADEKLSTDSTDNLAAFTVDVQSAASKAAREGVKAETQYDLKRAEAKRDYTVFLAAANYTKVERIADAELALTLATPVDPAEHAAWVQSGDAAAALATKNSETTAANAAYTAAVKSAKVAHAGQIGDAQITRITKLADAKVDEATEKKQAEIDYSNAEKNMGGAIETGITAATAPGIAGEASAQRAYNIVATTNHTSALDALAAAYVQFVMAMKPVNVAHVAARKAAEGNYHAAISAEQADVAAANAVGHPANSQAAFDAAQAAAKAQWISGMRPAVVAYWVAKTAAEADEGIALAQAALTAEAARGAADVAYVTAVESLSSQRTIDSSGVWREHAEHERSRAGTRNVAHAAARGEQAIDLAEAARDRAVAYATAEKTFHTGVEGATSYVPDPDWWEDQFEHPRRIAWAEADALHAAAQGGAEVAIVAGIVAGDKAYRDARAAGYLSLETQLAVIERDYVVARSGHIQTHALAWLAAQTAQWGAEASAASARRMAEAEALANLSTADYAMTATAIASIDAAMNLPWTQYIADKAVALSAWWIDSERANVLALAAALNSAEMTYRTQVSAGYTTWVTTTVAAESVYLQVGAVLEHAERIANAASEETYERALADAERDWQNGRIVNLKNRRTDYWSTARDEIIAGIGASTLPSWSEMLTVPDAADEPVDRAFFVAESVSQGIVAADRAEHWRDRVAGEDAAYLPYIQATAGANRAEIQAEEAAMHARLVAVATALAEYQVLSSEELADAMDALALASATPWAAYDAAIAGLTEDYQAAVAPAGRDLAIAVANAEQAFADAKSDGIETFSVALAQSSATHRLSGANAQLANTQAAAQARTLAAQTMPVSALAALPAAAATGDPSAATPGMPATGPSEPPRRTPGLPTPVPVATGDVNLGAITPPAHYDPSSTIPLQLPADGSNAHQDEPSVVDTWFGRTRITRADRDSSHPLQVLDATALKNLPFPVHVTTPILTATRPQSGSFGYVGLVLTPLPPGVTVDPKWTAEDIERAAIQIAVGGAAGPGYTAAERAAIERWISILKKHVEIAYREAMNYGEERDAIARLLKHWYVTGRLDRVGVSDSVEHFLLTGTYAELREILSRTFIGTTYYQTEQDIDRLIEGEIRNHRERRARMEKLAKDALKVNNNAENEKLILDVVQLLLDIGGIIDPTPATDGTSALISIARGETFAAAVSIISILPYAGDTVKLAKFTKYLETLAEIAKRAPGNAQLAKFVRPTLEVIVKTLDDVLPYVPKEIAAQLLKLRDAAYSALLATGRGIGRFDNIDQAIAYLKTKCFARDTLVSTQHGLLPIGKVQIGELVHSFDFTNGLWTLQSVTNRIDNVYQGPVISIEAGDSRIEATIHHPFWVVEGHEIQSRPRPRKLSPHENENEALQGRWVNSHELLVGDMIIGMDGITRVITRIAQRFEAAFPVSNLTIGTAHNYAVGINSLLVHNESICDVGITALQDMLDSGEATYDEIRILIQSFENADTVLARIVENSFAFHLHHAWPKYLGGPTKQDLVRLPKHIHDAYHRGLDEVLPRKATKDYYDKLSAAARKRLEEDLAEFTKGFDALHGTELYRAMLRNGFPGG